MKVTDRPTTCERRSGAVEITPEMADAGETAVYSFPGVSEGIGYFSGRDLAASVFLAMYRAMVTTGMETPNQNCEPITQKKLGVDEIQDEIHRQFPSLWAKIAYELAVKINASPIGRRRLEEGSVESWIDDHTEIHRLYVLVRDLSKPRGLI